MKASKLLVLVAGILGVVSFFLPLVSVHREDTIATLTAFQIVKSGDTVAVGIKQGNEKSIVHVDATTPDAHEDIDLKTVKQIVMIVFAPTVLLFIVGAFALMRGRFGRLAGLFSLLLGLVPLGAGLLMNAGANGDGGSGILALIAAGGVGALGGLLALISPDRGSVVR
jgi:hypothetical protein